MTFFASNGKEYPFPLVGVFPWTYVNTLDKKS